MKNFLLVFLLALTLGLSASAQIRLPGTHVSFQFPQGGWKYQNTFHVDKNTVVYLYTYTASVVVDGLGDTILPFLRIYVKNDCTDDIYSLAYSRYMQQPYQSLAEYTEGVPQPGLGYVGAYSSHSDKKDYQFRMVYFKDKDIALEFRAETTRDTYPAFDSLFDEILKTINLSSK